MNELAPGVEYYVGIADWNNDINDIKMIRSTVFIKEQKVPEELEWDEHDQTCTHFIVRANGNAVATARLKADGQIGRMAVLSSHRNKGIGSILLLKIMAYAKSSGFIKLYLHAQIQVTGFYQQHGFISKGKEFMDAGIKHRAMYQNLN